MASLAKTDVRTPREPKGPSLIRPVEIETQRVGTGLPRVEAPEGWVKKVERAREGKVWVGYFHVWEATPDGHSVRRKKEKTLTHDGQGGTISQLTGGGKVRGLLEGG